MSRVLIIEDSPSLGRFLQRTLSGHEFFVEVVTSSSQIVKAFDSPVDGILLEWMLEDGIGPGVLHCLKSEPHTSSIPIIVISRLIADFEDEVAADILALDHGAYCYLAEREITASPIGPEMLLRRVRAILLLNKDPLKELIVKEGWRLN